MPGIFPGARSGVVSPSTPVPPLVVRADADERVGTGHLLRCLALACAWRDRCGTVTFVSDCTSGDLRRRIRASGMELVSVEAPHPEAADLAHLLAVLDRNGSQTDSAHRPIVALDGYHFDTAYQRAVRPATERLLVIDDTAHLPWYCADVLLNPNISAAALHYACDPGCRRLFGTEYALLRPEFTARPAAPRTAPARARRVLITLGGVDAENRTIVVLRGLATLRDRALEARVVIGPGNPHRRMLRVAVRDVEGAMLVESPADMAEVMAWAEAAVAGGGSTCWELAYMGVPALVLVLADNQRAVAEGLDDAGAAWNLGDADQIAEAHIAEALGRLLDDRAWRQHMIERGRRIVDGHGAARVATALTEVT
jgi:UDP-2,4-diacetamido-2,4,6-trideoxy-beta-L-altropyranose hydrolase